LLKYEERKEQMRAPFLDQELHNLICSCEPSTEESKKISATSEGKISH